MLLPIIFSNSKMFLSYVNLFLMEKLRKISKNLVYIHSTFRTVLNIGRYETFLKYP